MHERRKRKFLSCCKALLFIAFFWCLIYFGFQNQTVDLEFDEHLDNAHDERLKNSRNPFYKYFNETFRRHKMSSESDESSSSSYALESHEERILNEFLFEKPTTIKKFVFMTDNRRNDPKTSESNSGIVWKETTGQYGEFQDDYYQMQVNRLDNPQPQYIDEINAKKEEVERIKEFMKSGEFKRVMDYMSEQAAAVQSAQVELMEAPAPDHLPDLEAVESALNKLNPGIQISKEIKEPLKASEVFGPQTEPKVSDKLEDFSSGIKEARKVESSSSTTEELKKSTESLKTLENVSKSKRNIDDLSKPQALIKQRSELSSSSSDKTNPTENEENSSSSSQTQETVIQNNQSYSDDSSSSSAILSGLPGDLGAAVELPNDIPDDIIKLVDEGWKNHEFNEYISNFISVHRSLKDFRTDYCMDEMKTYSKVLPLVSIIIVFYNEAWSTLVRSIYSVLDRSPSNLIKEIILVDDCSEFEHLKGQLDEFVNQTEKVRLVRNTKREGLIHSRNRGAKEANAEVLLFLDSHIECTEGWLEPLLDRIALNNSAIVVPVINKINDTTFELIPHEHPNYVTLGGFHWDLHFHWFYVQSEFYTNPLGPVITPTISGGLFAITKSFFMKLGMFDPGLEIWGGENLELSFKAWMCGGKIEIAQCSHVGHVFRKNSPYDWNNSTQTMRKNSMRVAKVWMDDFAVFYNYATGFDKIDYGDVSERIKLRNDLKCNSFEWYLKNIYPERTIPNEGISYGEIKNLGFGGKMCLSGNAEKESIDVSMKGCHGKGRDQFWMYNGVIERDNYCLTYVGQKLITKHCRHTDNQLFTYDPDKQTLYLRLANKCLEMTKNSKITLSKCDGKEGQKWKLENLVKERIKKF